MPTPTRVKIDGYAYHEVKPLIRATLDGGIAVLLRGHPGVGKSTLAAEVAAEMALPLIDIRLAQRDPAEIGGIHFPDREGQRLALLPPEWVKQACAAPAFIFLDEINAAVTRLHQSVAYQIVLERRVGPFIFHPGTVIMAAGNLDEDRAIVTPLSSALANRFAHFTLAVDVESWLSWATRVGLSDQVIGYMRANRRWGGSLLYKNEGGDAFPSPRSWAMAAQLLEKAEISEQKRLVAACVGPAAAEQFFAFLRLYNRVRPERIVGKGQVVDFTKGAQSEPSFAYAATSAVGRWLTENERRWKPEWADHIVTFLCSPGLDPEYAFLLLRDLNAKTKIPERLKPNPRYRALAAHLVAIHSALEEFADAA